MVMSAVLRPMRAAAMAASQPACPAPTTTTSYCSVKATSFHFNNSRDLSELAPKAGVGRDLRPAPEFA